MRKIRTPSSGKRQERPQSVVPPPAPRREREAPYAFAAACMFLFFSLLLAPPAFCAPEDNLSIQLLDNLSADIKTQYMIGSHTSYEFGNPEPPYQKPLSRLEFRLDSLWVGGGLTAAFPRFSIHAQALTNASEESGGHMRDSDWEDDANPGFKTTYSESQCRIDPSYDVTVDMDLVVSDWLNLPGWFDLRPVIGFRWQDFNFVVHDGTQFDLTGFAPPLPLAGDLLTFEQTYSQYFVGVRTALDPGKPFKLKSLAVRMQFDWAYVEADNQDHHLLREGNRYTYEYTYGNSWHGSIGLEAGVLEHLFLDLQADFLAIATTGYHRLVNASLGLNRSWSNGTRVWSDQNSLSLTLRYVF